MTHVVVATPLRRKLSIVMDGATILSSDWLDPGSRRQTTPWAELPATTHELRRQLEAYFARSLRCFELPLEFRGTDFEKAVWQITTTIPFGASGSYADVARAAGRPGAHRGVARAMGRTDFALFMPAHRVIGADGQIKGTDSDSMRVRLWEFEHSGRG